MRLRALVRDVWRRIAAYVADPDPRVSACNAIALIVVANQPFYPLYVAVSVSPVVWPTALTFLSTPFFAAVPALSRRWPRFGRALLPLTGMANVVVSAKAFGAASGAGVFLFPCALIAGAFFRPSERPIALALIALATAVFFAIDGLAPLHAYAPGEYAAFVRLNALSAGALVAFIGLLIAGLVRD